MEIKLDRFERVVFDSQYSVCILGNGKDFELIDPCPLSEERTRELSARHMAFLGVIGLQDGVPRVALACPLDDLTISALSAVFVHRIESGIVALEKAVMGASLAWLHRLYELPDNRSEVN